METPVNPSPSSLPTKQSRSPSKHQFLSKDGVDNVFDMNYPPMEPMRLPWKKMQNDYIHKWLPQKEDFLQILLDLEAPPLPHTCRICGKDGVYRVQQWTGDFFEDSALHMTGLQLHLGHDGAPCPSTSTNVQATLSGHSQPAGLDEEEWGDIDYIPLHLHPPVGSKYLTVINMTGKAITSSYSMQSYIHQPLKSQAWELLQVAWQWCLLKLLKWSGYQGNLNDSMKGDLAIFCAACPQPGINLSPQANLDGWRYTRTVVMDGNFKVEHMHEWRPDDQVWLMDGHSFMVTNPRYWEYIATTPHITEKSACNNHKAISQTSASHGKLNSMGVGATACVWHGCFYPHSVVDFQKGKRQVDNTKFLEITPLLRIVVGIGMWHVHGHKKECYARYSPLFIRGSGWVNGEIIETLWSTLNIVSTSTHGMTSLHRQELLDFQMNDSNFMKMIHMISGLSRKLKVAQAAVTLAQEAFERLNEAVPSSQQENWWRQEEAALKDCVHDPSVMDIFEIQLTKVHGIELHLLQTSTTSGMHHGAASWLTCGLVIEEAEVMLSINRVAAEQKTFITDGRIYLQMDTALDDSEESDRNHEVASQNILGDDNISISSNGSNSNCSADDMQDTNIFMDPTSPTLPLPSNLGANRCHDIGIHRLAEMELELHIAQANDTLHGLCLALADKAVIFRGVVRTAMITLGAKPEILKRYQELQKSHLTTSTAAFTQGAHDHRASQLPWFWSIDIPRDTSSKSWLTEFYRIHWLCAKAGKDCWEEEEELLTLEFQWVINYF
ncbi:hypothetical protein EDD16DRAFT_1518803 [Pisolithus croceorrhizus]|nr:hypothetical protein EDD16DRAFT_1518803 [Pisolithus croceorrhizus]